MGSSRFPDKVMAEIAGAPMIVQVWRRAMEADDARRAELKRIRDEHDAVLNQAAKDDFQARIDHARARAEDRMYGRIRDILDKEDRRN